MRRGLTVGLLMIVTLSACAAPATTQPAAISEQQVEVIVFKPAN